MKALMWGISLMLVFSAYAQDKNSHPAFKVTKVPLAQFIELDGVVQPVNQGSLAAQTSGRVVGLFVDVNDVVTKGQVLLEISAVQQSAALDAAKAQLTSALAQQGEAQTQLNRYRQLFPKGAITQDQIDSALTRARSAEAGVKSAQAAVDQAKEALGYTNITAPYDGIVTQRMVELGETVAPGTPLLRGFSLDELRVEIEIPQRYQPYITNVEQFTVHTAKGAELKPTAFSQFNYADPQSHTFKTRLVLPEKITALLPGMWVKTQFKYGQRDALVVPTDAVLQRAELSAVYRIENGQRVLNPVRLGVVDGDYVEVLAGLDVGDEIETPALTQKGK